MEVCKILPTVFCGHDMYPFVGHVTPVEGNLGARLPRQQGFISVYPPSFYLLNPFTPYYGCRPGIILRETET
jgi:hypothetical protein